MLMRACGGKRSLFRGAGRRIAVGLSCVAGIAGLYLASPDSGLISTSTVLHAVISPASANGLSRRSREKAAEDLQRAEQLQKRTQLQQNDALQRLRNIQNLAAAQQKRIQLQLQVEEVQKKVQQVQQQAAAVQQQAAAMQQQTAAMQKHLHVFRTPAAHALTPVLNRVEQQQQQTQAILKRVQDMRAHFQPKHQPLAVNMMTVPRLAPVMRHQMVVQQVLSRLRHQHGPAVGYGSAGHFAIVRAGSIGHHHSVLLATMARARNPYMHGHGLAFQRGPHYQPLQHAIYHRMFDKLSWHHRKQQPTPTVAKAPETKVTTPVKNATSGVSMDGLGNNTQSTQNNTVLPNAPIVVADAASKVDTAMHRLGGPQQPKSDDDDAGGASKGKRNDTKDTKKDDPSPGADPKAGDPKAADSKAAKPAGRGSQGPVDLGFLPANKYVPKEVLAFNLSDAGRARAKALNFTLEEEVKLGALGSTVARLKTPSDQPDPVGAIGTLVKEAPADAYDYNRVYVPYRTTSDASPSGAGNSAPPPGSRPIPAKPAAGANIATGCPSERCFAPALIKWQPQLGACARDMRIGVIDTDYDKSHPAFSGAKIIAPTDSILPPGSTKAANVHATAVMSLLVGNASSSTPGLLPEGKVYYSNAFYADASGSAMSSTMTMLKALNFMMASKVDVLNLSFAGPQDQQVHNALIELAKRGTVILAAAGSDGPQAPPTFPAAYPEAIAVTAVDRNLAIYPYANRGAHIAVAAPGVDVWTALPDKREGMQTGTSFAVPFATSVVALNYPTADQRANGDPLAPRQRALDLLQKSIKPIGGNRQVFGAGLIQAPSQCDPHAPVAAVAANGWTSKVEVAPSAQTGGNSWTVHSVKH